MSPFFNSYFQISDQPSNYVIDFIHKSFMDYLLAEYYLESMLINKPFRLNVGSPSPETISFMKSLLILLNNNNNDDQITKLFCIKFIDSVFLNSKIVIVIDYLIN